MKTCKTAEWVLGLTVIATVCNTLALEQSNPAPSSKSGPVTAGAVRGSAVGTALGAVPPSAEYPIQTVAVPPDHAPPPKQSPEGVHLSLWAGEVAKLAQARIDDGVIMSFIDSVGTFNLATDQIILLRDLGVSNSVINAMIQHDAAVLSGALQVTASVTPTLSNPVVPGTSPASAPQPGQPSAPVAPMSAPALGSSPTGQGAGDVASQTASHDAPAAVFAPILQPDPGSAEELEPGVELGEDQAGRRPVGLRSAFPVREPYPVPLTDPIMIVRAHTRPPNVQVIVSFP